MRSGRARVVDEASSIATTGRGTESAGPIKLFAGVEWERRGVYSHTGRWEAGSCVPIRTVFVRTTLLQDTLDLLILKALTAAELHGLGVSRRIEQITGGTFIVQPGSLFPALHRLEEAGWLNSTWQPSENNRRAKYHTLTRAGRKQLGEETAQ
jgi:PadR family transcriptional regulator, regulatory protein PadR